jgi:Xaa-Pro aminopeptidase
MERGRLDAMVLSSRVNVEYFAGFASEGWETPTRPIYIVLPREGTPVGVISSGIRTEWTQSSWIEELVTWESPRVGDEGVTEIRAVLADLPQKCDRVGLELGPESRIGMPIADFRLLEQSIAPTEVHDCSWICRDVRIVKSEAEIGQVELACIAACDAFDELPQKIRRGASEIDAARAFKVLVHAAGADRLPFCAVSSGVDGYDRFTSSATHRRLSAGDVLFLDVGAIVNGYSCDFNRNFAIGHTSDVLRRRFEVLWHATHGIVLSRR